MAEKGYNTFISAQPVVYNVISKLINDEEDIWKLLKYNESDALDRPPLTKAEKASLIYDGVGKQNDYRVFRSPYVEDMVSDEQTQIRIFTTNYCPLNKTLGMIDVMFEFVTHNKIISLSGYMNRIEFMAQRIIEIFNGVDLGGASSISFDYENNENNMGRLNLYNNRNYIGFRMALSIHIGDPA